MDRLAIEFQAYVSNQKVNDRRLELQSPIITCEINDLNNAQSSVFDHRSIDDIFDEQLLPESKQSLNSSDGSDEEITMSAANKQIRYFSSFGICEYAY